jgi:hypothetical protein
MDDLVHCGESLDLFELGQDVAIMADEQQSRAVFPARFPNES